MNFQAISNYCKTQTCPRCILSDVDGGCLITDSPPADWDVEAIERAISQIGLQKAREAIDRWGLE